MKSKLVHLCAGVLFAAILGLYWQCRNYDFINYDDGDYVYKNEFITNGLTTAGIKWAFDGSSAELTANWHPLTFLSLMTDVQLFGVSPGPIHLHNVLLHGIDSVLLFFFLMQLLSAAGVVPAKDATKPGFITACFLAALFWAVHPLRVESVAWISSRKDVLCILFFLTGLLCHLQALRKESQTGFLGLSGLCFAFAFMSKPTAVIYPVVALALEFLVARRVTWKKNELLIYLMVVFMGVTFFVQNKAAATTTGIPFPLRIENCIGSIGQYAMQTVWPKAMAVFYHYEVPIPFSKTVPGGIFILILLVFTVCKGWPVLKDVRSGRGVGSENTVLLLLFAIVWFLVTLGPVIGLIQVGMAACADRYTYLSGIAFSIAAAIGLHKLFGLRLKILTGLCVAAAIGLLSLKTMKQCKVWSDSLSVWKNAVAVSPENPIANFNAGFFLLEQGNYAEAFPYALAGAEHQLLHTQVLRMDKNWNDKAVENLGLVFVILAGEPVTRTNGLIRVNTNNILPYEVKPEDPLRFEKILAQGLTAFNRGLSAVAEQKFVLAGQIRPEDPYLWRFLGYLYLREERESEALLAFQRAAAIKSDRNLESRIRKLKKIVGPL